MKFAAREQRTLDELYSRSDENIIVRWRRCKRRLRDVARRKSGIGRVCLRKEKAGGEYRKETVMLCLGRKYGQRVRLVTAAGEEIWIFGRRHGDQFKLHVDAPPSVEILREELIDRRWNDVDRRDQERVGPGNDGVRVDHDSCGQTGGLSA